MGCLLIPAVAVIASFMLTRHKERLTSDVGYARTSRAHTVAKKRLNGALSALHQHQQGVKYDE